MLKNLPKLIQVLVGIFVAFNIDKKLTKAMKVGAFCLNKVP